MKIIENFKHKVGFHCESSAMRDLFEYYGFPISEAMAFGLDGTLGFIFYDPSTRTGDGQSLDTPYFIGGKGGTIEPNSLACRLLGITLRKQSYTSADKAWKESKILIGQDYPLILQVDLGFLPYMQGQGEIHFGGHSITLAGYDDQEGVAFVGDTEYENFQEINIEDLKKARSSTHGPSFLHPNNTQFSMSRRADGKHPPLAAGIKLAIQEAVNHMLRASVNYIGIQGLKKFADSIPNWKEDLKGTVKNPYSNKQVSLASLTFELVYGFIETWGPGGGLFRNLFASFLEEVYNYPEINEGNRAWDTQERDILSETIPLIINSAQNWTEIATLLKSAVDKNGEDCINNVDLKTISDIAFQILKFEELAFKKLLEIKL